MEENEKMVQISYAKNMNKFNFNSTVNIQIDNNANIKTVLDINSYIFDQKVECGNGKAIISGKIGIKVLYLDLDNMTNIVTESTSFSETYLDNSITSATYLNMSNATIINNILSTDNNLKINCEVSINPVAYLNLALTPNLSSQEMLITKKSEVLTHSISKVINTHFEHTSSLETKDNISKILCHNSYFCPEKITPEEGLAVVEGKMISYILYETTHNEDVVIKEMRETSNLKYDIEINSLSKESILDLSFILDKSNEEISTEMEDENNVVLIKNKIQVCGIALKNVSIDIVDDVYSTESEIEASTVKREYTKRAETISVAEITSNEITLTNDEPAIDEVVSNLGITPEITNTYIKDGNVFVEGIVSSNLTYIDETKEFKHKQVEIPFIINTKINAETLGCVHNEIYVVDAKVKVKRGTIIEMEYSLFINLSLYEKETHDMVDNFTIGKPLDFSKYDFQIFLAKAGETMWDLCKRIKISPDDIHKYNKDLPLIMQGGEKVIIKR